MIRILLLCFILCGCERISGSEVYTTFATAGAAAASAAIWTNPVGIAAGGVAGGLAAANITSDQAAVTAKQLAEVTNPWQAFVLAFDQLLSYAFEIVIAIGIALIGIPMLLTYVMGRMRQRPEDAKQISNLVKKIGEMKE